MVHEFLIFGKNGNIYADKLISIGEGKSFWGKENIT
jgi:hypothetical protein